jgi:hypothetical protein
LVKFQIQRFKERIIGFSVAYLRKRVFDLESVGFEEMKRSLEKVLPRPGFQT